MQSGFTILFHSSKTMRASSESSLRHYNAPLLLGEASELMKHLQRQTPADLARVMKISQPLAEKTHTLLKDWQPRHSTLPAIDAFLGDMYSGLQAHTLNESDRTYAHAHFFILSGLYGVVRALDNISPYRLEMGYRLAVGGKSNLYEYWGDSIAKQIPKGTKILNLSVQEYTKAVLPYLSGRTIVTPVFLTIKDGKPQAVVVHAKIARGAFARWVIANRIEDTAQLRDFQDIGYKYNETLSTASQPVYVAKEFQGLGLSVRLSK